MGYMVLKQSSPSVYQYLILNRISFSTRQMSPAVVMDMPENKYSNAIITKVEGNTRQIIYSWKLVDMTGGSYTSLVFDGSTPTPNPIQVTFSDTSTGYVLTPQQQYDFLMNVIENNSINNQYYLTMYDSFPSPATKTVPNVNYQGIIQDLTIDQGEGDAANYTATLTFIAGNVVTVSSQ